MAKANPIPARPTKNTETVLSSYRRGDNGQNMRYKMFYLDIKKLFFDVQVAKQSYKLFWKK